jgi:hypothetical protein
MTEPPVDRTTVLLLLQRALLGEVFSTLRRVTVEWTDRSVSFIAYVDGPVSDADAESLRCVETELVAGFPPEVLVSHELIRIDAPAQISDTRISVFRRREE